MESREGVLLTIILVLGTSVLWLVRLLRERTRPPEQAMADEAENAEFAEVFENLEFAEHPNPKNHEIALNRVRRRFSSQMKNIGFQNKAKLKIQWGHKTSAERWEYLVSRRLDTHIFHNHSEALKHVKYQKLLG